MDVQAIGADFFAFSAHKLFGPFGMGVLWGRDELLNAMPPFLTGGEMIDSVTEQDATWAPVPRKAEAGTQDAAGIYATAAAIAYVESVGIDVIAAREQALVRATAWRKWRSCLLRHHHRQFDPDMLTKTSASTSTASTRMTWPAHPGHTR